MYAPGTTSVIMARLFERSAPGSRAMACRLTVLCVVDERGSTAAVVAVTCISSLTAASARSIGTWSTAPELRTSEREEGARPAAFTSNL